MAITGLPNPTVTRTPLWFTRRPRRGLILCGFVLLGAVMTGIWFAGQYWPFRYRIMKPLLEDTFGCQIAIQHYHRTYFPNPGFVAEGLTLRRKSAPHQPPIGTIVRLTIQSHWSDLFLLRKRIQLLEMDSVHLVLPPPGSPASKEDFPPGSAVDFDGPETRIQTLQINNSQLDILRTDGGRFSFPVAQLHFENVHRGEAATFAVDMMNPLPTGHIRASGRFGPLQAKDIGATPASGEFHFTSVQLHDIGNISGTLSSYGRFHGRLDALEAEGTSHTPDFAVDGGHPTPVDGQVHCSISAIHGDVILHTVDLRMGRRSTLHVTGDVRGNPEKSTHLEITLNDGRVEDILQPFVHHAVPVTGPVALHAHVYLAPSSVGSFFHRLQVDGAFDIPAERITQASAERSLSIFSLRAQDKKAPDADDKATPVTDAISSLRGPASIRDEIATTRGLAFSIPGAQASLGGTYNLHTESVHLTGDLRMQSDISHATTGFKSILLKPLAPFFRKKHAGAVVPIAITGTPGHYQVQQNLDHSK